MLIHGRRFLDRLRLRPWWHALERPLCERPAVLGQARRHHRRTGAPHLGRATAVGGFGTQQRLAQAGMGQTAMIIHVGQRQLLTEAVLAFA